MSLTPFQRFHLKKFVKELEQSRALHTEFVSVYIPAGYDLNKIIGHLSQEQGTASNIKSAGTRNNVIDAIERMIQHLRLFKQNPKNGLAVFSGNVASREGRSDVRVWSVEPPTPLNTRLYRCDKVFHLDILKDMLDEKEVYGLIVMDARDAIIAILKGKTIIPLMKTHSQVPGKMKAGGQCLDENSLLMLDDGGIISIKESHNPLKTISADLNEQKTVKSNITHKWTNKKEVLRITTKYPKLQVDTSKDHTFFVRRENGVEEKTASLLKKGDFLIIPEKINVDAKDQEIIFLPLIKKESSMKKVKIPKKINSNFARILGYYLGDGSYELDRLTFSEQRGEVAKFYKELIEKTFNLEIKMLFRKDKNYYQLRCYSRIISQLFLEIFPEKDKTMKEKIPQIVLKSSDVSLAQFVGGFFDAEGYVSSNRVAAGVNNELIIKQLQLALLRLGIISSVLEYSNERNPYSKNMRYTLCIDDIQSICKFSEEIKFASEEKQKKLEKIIKERKNRNNVRQIFVKGKEINNLLKQYNIRVRDYGLSGFLNNKRQLNKELFKQKLIDSCKIPELKKKLLKFYNSSFIPVKISSIKNLGVRNTVDIETSSHNFFANGILVHNSAHRFQQNREIAVKDHYKKVADYVKEQFLMMVGLKGIIIGGPGPTKYEFADGDYLTGDLKKKVLGIKDLSYTEEFGLQEMVDKSQDILAQEEIADEKKIMNRFFELLATKPGIIQYGENEVRKVLEMGAVDVLLLSEDLTDEKIEEFEAIAKNYSTTIKIISVETREGAQFKEIGKVGAILRYELNLD